MPEATSPQRLAAVYRLRPDGAPHLMLRSGEADTTAVSTAHALTAPGHELGHGLAELRSVSGAGPGRRAGTEPDRGTISPELALVCPELRDEAIAGLPDRDPNGFLPPPSRAPVPHLIVEVPDPPVRPRQPSAVSRVALAASAYLAVEAARTVAYAAGLTGGLVGAMSLAELFRG